MLWNLVLAGVAITWAGESSEWFTGRLAEICPAFVSGMALPAPRYLDHPPQYFPPTPPDCEPALQQLLEAAQVPDGPQFSFWDPRQYPGDRRTLQMLNTAEDLREIEDEWNRFWFSDPSQYPKSGCIKGSLE